MTAAMERASLARPRRDQGVDFSAQLKTKHETGIFWGLAPVGRQGGGFSSEARSNLGSKNAQELPWALRKLL